MQAIRKAIKRDGTWLIADVHGQPTFEQNLKDNPLAPVMYGFSVLYCMSSALSEPGGLGLGTLGLPEPVARKMTAGPGFTRFMPRDFENPINAYCVRSDCPCPAQPNKALRSVAGHRGPTFVRS